MTTHWHIVFADDGAEVLPSTGPCAVAALWATMYLADDHNGLDLVALPLNCDRHAWANASMWLDNSRAIARRVQR